MKAKKEMTDMQLIFMTGVLLPFFIILTYETSKLI